MAMLAQLRALTADQRNAFLAAYLGWTLDAFDYFLLVFVLKDVEKEFHASAQQGVTLLFVTLACRPIGALLFGAAADRFGAAAAADGRCGAVFGAGAGVRDLRRP